MAKIKINFVVDSIDDDLLYRYLENIPIRRRAMFLRILACNNLSSCGLLGNAAGAMPVNSQERSGELMPPANKDNMPIRLSGNPTATPDKGAEVAKSIVDLIDFGTGQ